MRKKNNIPKKILILACAVFIIGSVWLSSYESSLNIKIQKTEKEISVLESEIDGLSMKMQELTSFTRLSRIAQSDGYEYRQTATNVAVISKSE